MQTANKIPGKGLVSETIQGGFCVDTVERPNPGFIIMNELWKDIPRFPGYRINRIGEIKSLKRNLKNGREFIIKPYVDRLGYIKVELRRDGQRCGTCVHRLLAIVFIPNPENRTEINHKNGIKADNRIENLEWSTRSENILHAYKNGLIPMPKGERNGSAKLNEFQVRVIRKCPDMTHEELGEIFNTDFSNVSLIRLRKTWKHI